MTDINLVPTEDLLDELENRFDHMCFVGAADHTRKHHVVNRRWDGDAHYILGLVRDASEFVLQDYYKTNGLIGNDDTEEEEDWT